MRKIKHRIRLRRALALLVAMLVAMAWPAALRAEVTVTAAAKGYDVDVSDQASVSEVIDAIVTATGVKVVGAPEDGTIASLHLRSASLERVLRALLPHEGFALRFNADDTPDAIIFLSAENAAGAGDGADAGPDGSDGGSEPDTTEPDMTEPDSSGSDSGG